MAGGTASPASPLPLRYGGLEIGRLGLFLRPTAMASIVPYFSYVDAATAVAWLESAFGLEPTVVVPDEDGVVVHAEMRHRGAYIMLGQVDHRPAGQPAGPGVYLVVEDVDAHHERARSAGADIVYPPEDTPFGTRRYRARDVEGYEWSFGTYAPGSS